MLSTEQSIERVMEMLGGAITPTIFRLADDTFEARLTVDPTIALEALRRHSTPEWAPAVMITTGDPSGEHGSQSSGYDGNDEYWLCRCGWTVRVPVGRSATQRDRQSAIDMTYGAFQAHKVAAMVSV